MIEFCFYLNIFLIVRCVTVLPKRYQNVPTLGLPTVRFVVILKNNYRETLKTPASNTSENSNSALGPEMLFSYIAYPGKLEMQMI